jgi:hypothetical protein
MFYAGNDTWKLRFTGTRIGGWSFITTSGDSDLDGFTGTVTVNPNSNPDIKGFLTSSGTKFARQISESGELDPFVFNVYQSNAYGAGPHFWYDNPDLYNELDAAIAEIRSYGCSILYSGIIANRWFDISTQRHDEHSSTEPDLRTFEALEQVIVYLHSQGMHLHMWAWGDEYRKMTPIGAGGINGIPDRRVQRYVAARLGPIPGWTMGYGFDLQEWVTEGEIESWAQYMHDHFGWQHLLWGRGRVSSELDAKSYSGLGPNSYSDVVNDVDSDPNRPHIYEERFIYERWGKYDMDTTRRQWWWNVMAGGMGSWWGRSWDSGADYPNPEQLRTHNQFWEGRFLLDMVRANSITDGCCLKSSDNTKFVFYKENAGSIQMDLSEMAGPQVAIAADTKLEYSELNLGALETTSQTWMAPYTSDWAIAVGDFSSGQICGTPASPNNLRVIRAE